MGAYGVVWLVEHKQTKDLYAMKIVDAEDAVNSLFIIFFL